MNVNAVKQTTAPNTWVCQSISCNRIFTRRYLYRQHIDAMLASPDENHKLTPENFAYPAKKQRQPRSKSDQKYKTVHQIDIRAKRNEYNPCRLDVILQKSRSLSDTHSTRGYAADIVQFLRKHRVCRRKDYQAVELPNDTTIRLLIDVLHLCALDEQPPQSLDITSSAMSKQFLDKSIAALFALERDSSTDTTASPAHAASLWSIPASAEGLQQWSGTIREELVRMNPGLIIDEVYTTTLSPAGMFSTWHIDQTWGGTVLVGLDFPKLFIMCPPTDRNIEEYEKIDQFGNFDESLKALSKFDQLSYIVLIKGDVYILPAGYIHLVLSMQNSAVGGWACFKAEWADMAKNLTLRDIARFVEEDKAFSDDIKALGGGGRGGSVSIRSAKAELTAKRRKSKADKLELERKWARAEKIYTTLQQSNI